MIGHLIRKEILDQVLSLRFLILSGVGALVIGLSLCSGYTRYQDRLEDYRLGKAATGARLQQLAADGDYWETAVVGFAEHKPPTPLSVFVWGLDPNLGRSISNAEVVPQRLRQSPVEAEPILGVFPPLDMGLVVQVVLSLFVLLLTYDAICGEKEAGTLRLLASFPVPRHRLLLGKALGVLIPLILAFGMPLVLGIAALLCMPGMQITGSEWIRLGLILTTCWQYLLTFACAGLMASCLTPRSATSFVLLLIFWIATVVVLPRLSLIVAEGFRPAPSVHEYQAEREAVAKQYLLEWRKARVKWQTEHSQPGKEWRGTPEGREAEYRESEKTRVGVYEQRWGALARLDESFRNRYDARLSLAVAIARISPSFAFKNGVVRLAGTGIDRHQRFETTFTRDYFKGQFYGWLMVTQDRYNLQDRNPAKYGERKWDTSGMPRFVFVEDGSGGDLQKALIDLATLALWGLAFFSGAYVAVMGYDVR